MGVVWYTRTWRYESIPSPTYSLIHADTSGATPWAQAAISAMGGLVSSERLCTFYNLMYGALQRVLCIKTSIRVQSMETTACWTNNVPQLLHIVS
jgi:hypothetical protein